MPGFPISGGTQHLYTPDIKKLDDNKDKVLNATSGQISKEDIQGVIDFKKTGSFDIALKNADGKVVTTKIDLTKNPNALSELKKMAADGSVSLKEIDLKFNTKFDNLVDGKNNETFGVTMPKFNLTDSSNYSSGGIKTLSSSEAKAVNPKVVVIMEDLNPKKKWCS
jgi:hypothetical protein